jgi:subtilisin family serine protease
MFKNLLFAVLILTSISVFSQESWLSKPLRDSINSGNSNLDVLIVFKSKCNLDSLQNQFRINKTNTDKRAKTTLKLLQKTAFESQKNVYSFLLQTMRTSNNAIDSIRPFWICNAIYCKINPQLIDDLLDFREIEHIELTSEKTVFAEKTIVGETQKSISPGGKEQGLVAIKAPALWAMGYTGQSRILYSVDTGVWPTHPAISNRFLANYFPYSQTWFPFDSQYPSDKSNSHGTHTIGTVLGLQQNTNDTIGVAFNSYFIAADPIVQDLADVKPITVIMSSFEWAMNPDGDTTTTSDMPDAINNSWGIALTPQDDTLCVSVVSDLLNAVEAAGIAAIFSAGNEGPGAQTVGRPAFISNTVVNNFSVGALDGNNINYPIASFSSRGPSVCGGEGSILIKPEVSAPGVNVRSCVGTNSYSNYSGTSMAGPHVAGAVLLLKEAFPSLPGEEIKLALYYTAIDLGEPGEDNVYGMGMIDVLAAYNYLANIYTPAPPASKKYDLKVEKILLPLENGILCSPNFTPKIIIKNNGDSLINGVKIYFNIQNNSEQNITLNSTMSSGQIDTVNLSPLTFNQSGLTEFFVRTEILNSNATETDVINNRRVSRFNYIPEANLPFNENFENGNVSQNFIIKNPNNDATWKTDSTAGLAGSNVSAVMPFNSSIDFNNVDELISPVFNFSNTDSVTLKFSVAYKLRATQLSDSLKVLLSNNCGESFDYSIYNKGGNTLSTSTGTINNYLPTISTDWREESINLNQFAGQNGIVLKFIAKNRKGNYLSLDNIWLYNGVQPNFINELTIESPTVYPNPANEYLIINFPKSKINNPLVNVYSIDGKKVLSENSNIISVQTLGNGIYFVETIAFNTSFKSKIVISK